VCELDGIQVPERRKMYALYLMLSLVVVLAYFSVQVNSGGL